MGRGGKTGNEPRVSVSLFRVRLTINPAIFSILNASMMSPTLTSWYRSRPMPHSKPCLTSETSSLKRRREAILPS